MLVVPFLAPNQTEVLRRWFYFSFLFEMPKEKNLPRLSHTLWRTNPRASGPAATAPWPGTGRRTRSTGSVYGIPTNYFFKTSFTFCRTLHGATTTTPREPGAAGAVQHRVRDTRVGWLGFLHSRSSYCVPPKSFGVAFPFRAECTEHLYTF